MSNKIIFEILKYIDCFGTTFTFYTEKSRKFYTALGGILTLFSIISGLLIFIYINLDDFLHNNPNSTTSTERDQYRIIKFKDEKIWIPWRIRNFGGKTINHKNILYPIIFYYKGIRNNSSESLDISYELINYKLCNETSMINNSHLYVTDIDIGKFYCIDMEDLDIGGSWDSNFLYLITLDLYTCKDGINYDENNTNCTSYEKIIETAGINDCFEFEMYYPVVQYQPINKTNPVFIRYYNYFYHLSRFSNKIDRLYLQKHIFKDDTGWVLKNEKSSSHWGTVSLNGDSYTTGNIKDLMNEGSTSRLYSFNIYLKSDIIYYQRSYKKIYLILADGLPIINIVFIFFLTIAKILKVSSGNKKLTELLFENLKIKKMKINNNNGNLNSLKRNSKAVINNKMGNINSCNNLKFNLKNKNINDISSFKLIQNNSGQKIIFPIGNKYNKSKKTSIKNYKIMNTDNIANKNIYFNKKLEDLFSIRSNNNLSSNLNNSSKDFQIISNKNDKKSIENISMQQKSKTLDKRYIKKTLFPYRYYLCSIFIKNIDVYRNYIFFSKKFIVVYNFICQLFDISSYLILQKEFEIMKNTILVDKYKDILENRQKINVNDLNFNINMKECLDSKKFSILGKVN